MDLLDRHRAHAGASRERHGREDREINQEDLLQLADTKPDDRERQVGQGRDRPVELDREVITDTRTLRFYYRKLPDNRVQIGSRSRSPAPTRQSEAHAGAGRRAAPQVPGAEGHRDRLLLVGLGRRQPRHDAAHLPARPAADGVLRTRLWRQRRHVLGPGRAAHGRAGRRQGQKLDLPIFASPLPGHVFAPFRRLGQRMLYRWYYLHDEYL